MGWLIALGVLVALAILPIGVSACYDADGPVVAVIAGPLRIRLFPTTPKEKKKKTKKPVKKEKKTKSQDAHSKDHPTAKKGGSWTDFLPLVKIVLEMLNAFRRKLRVNRLFVKIIMAGGDPCDLAVNYGKAWAALGNLMPHLERALIIKERDLEVECDFTADQTLVIARLDLTITLGRLLSWAVWHGIRVLYHFIKILNKRKGGTVK